MGHKDVGVLVRFVLAGGFSILFGSATIQAGAIRTQDLFQGLGDDEVKVTESHEYKDGKFTYTVVVENITTHQVGLEPGTPKPDGAAARGLFLDVWPKNNGVRNEKGQKQTSEAFFLAPKGSKDPTGKATDRKTFVFTSAGFTDAEDKKIWDSRDWNWRYADVGDYDTTDPNTGKVPKVLKGVEGFWVDPVPQTESLPFLLDGEFSSPLVLALFGGGPTDIFIDVIGETLPMGWFVTIDPAPGVIFRLDSTQSQPVRVTFGSSMLLVPGEMGIVSFDFVSPEFNFRWNSEAAVQIAAIPEPPTLTLFTAVILALRLNLGGRRASGSNQVRKSAA